MNTARLGAAFVCTLSACLLSAPGQASAPAPLPRAHAHNDYEHARPLFDALDQGFCSVEADIYLIEGQLLVAHDRGKVSKERTLQRLYLDPLQERARENQGRVYPNGPSVILLIDLKSEGAATYTALRNVLQSYAPILTRFERGKMESNAVTVIISGNRPRQLMAAETVRFAAYDGRPEDLDGSAPSDFIPLISEDWKKLFKWRGEGPFPEAERRRLRELVDKAHQQGRKIRFWGTPDRPAAWRELYESGADLLNTDDLSGLRAFLVGQASRP